MPSLEEWQQKAMEQVKHYHEQAFMERKLLTPMVMSLPNPPREQLVAFVASAAQKCCGLNSLEAEGLARASLQCPAVGAGADGVICVSPYAWAYTTVSLWRGNTDNKKLARITRSILNGFNLAEPIQSRTNDLSDWDGSNLLLARLLFGDGQARGLGVRFAWSLLLDHIKDDSFQPSPATARVFRSLIAVPVVFQEAHRGISSEQRLVECAVTQNIKAQMTQPLTLLEWIHMILSLAISQLGDVEDMLDWSFPNKRREMGQKLVRLMEAFLHKYTNHALVQAYDMEAGPAVKRPRRGRASRDQRAIMDDNPQEDSLKIGDKRIKAMKNILMFISQRGLERWNEHLVWVGHWKYNAMQDNVAASPNLWPHSLLPEDKRPNTMQDMAREVGAKVSEQILEQSHQLARGSLLYNEELTPEQHEMMLTKGFEIYETETLHLTNLKEKLHYRPDLEQWLRYRIVIEHWDRTIRSVAKQDMSDEDFLEFEAAVLKSNVMDQQIMDAIRGYPKTFHLAMIPDLKANFEEHLDQEQKDMELACLAVWEASLKKFKLQLQTDQRLIRNTQMGSKALADILEWLELKSKIALQQEARELASAFLYHYFPVVKADSWDQLAGAYAVAMNMEVPRKEAVSKLTRGRHLVILKLNFNVPNTRDGLKLGSLCSAMATLARQAGPSNAILVVALATRPKEDASDDALDRGAYNFLFRILSS